MTPTESMHPGLLSGEAPTAPLPQAPNPEADLAYAFVRDTNRHVFLTGRAGTGKTTLLHRIRETVDKQLVVAAPTGVAAINARGSTIHSLFQLPFGLLTPERLRSELGRRQLAKSKQRVLRGLDLLIIDEISMVRADVLDAIDFVLRRYRDRSRPFGGVQLLLIGDLHQLPPVVRDDEWASLRSTYDTPYFFSSVALRGAGVTTVELQHIYRQSDADFIELLGHVRRNELTPDVIERLDSRFREFDPVAEPGYITLSSHRNGAARINAERLGQLAAEPEVYTATVDGDFAESAYPTAAKLELKLGAQVMFVRNDISEARAYYNGLIGRITAFDEETVTVTCDANDGGGTREIVAAPTTWENTKYQLDERSKRVGEQVVGSFTQVPLKLAWAITIHKSQGLTFERVVIDAAAAFAHGQVYVALSRCRTFEGLVLISRIGRASVQTDKQVSRYTEQAREVAPDALQLAEAKADFQRDLLRQTFDFRQLYHAYNGLLRYYLEHERSYVIPDAKRAEALVAAGERKIFEFAEGFRGPLEELLLSAEYGGDTVTVPDRARRGAHYFAGQLTDTLQAALRAIDFASDNAEVTKRTEEHLAEIEKLERVKAAELAAVAAGDFDPQAFIRARVAADLADPESNSRRSRSSSGGGQRVPSQTTDQAASRTNHPALFATLRAWRGERASEAGNPAYTILTTRALLGVADTLPRDNRELKSIHGIGKVTVERYGADILRLVTEYSDTLEAS